MPSEKTDQTVHMHMLTWVFNKCTNLIVGFLWAGSYQFCTRFTSYSSIAPNKAFFFKQKAVIFFLFCHENICCGHSFEVPHLTEALLMGLFVLRFYGPVNPMGSRSVYLTTRLLGRLSPLSGSPVLCTFFRQKLTTALLESVEGREWP